MLLCSIPLEPEDGDIEVVLSEEVHGPEIIWKRDQWHMSFSLGETRAGGVLEMTWRIGRSVFSEADEALLRGEGEARDRTVASGGDGGHATEMAGEPSRLN